MSSSKKDKRRLPPPDPEPLPGLIDAHTHLAACGGRTPEAVKEILDHAEAVGVSHVVTVADDMVDARWAVQAAKWDSRAFAAVGLHPTHAADLNDQTRAELEEMLSDERVVAVGETGLDYYWTTRSQDCADPATQRDVFAWHIDLAKRTGKALMIHNRDADGDLLDVLKAEGSPDTVVMHCFSGDRHIAAECVERNYYLSFSGTVTFTNADELRAAAHITPAELMLVETDAPFLTPHPYRGQPNQSYCVPYTARALAAVKGLDDREMATILGANARRAYSLPLR
ncbi:TatD DNase family protein [Gordonia malaquae]|uniref:Putative deoxyribonuclease n=1 Tax=Gordonia malaquae NBRC 108250 TaxID=1223542 RepID=M3THZ0_GORML|nr:TatD family hydrolase [Gordonia malaquae]GAC81126.1 putative deoxyribonuclease [Gordonia malaquae NBRC 108250]SEC00051.1 TatD DNase family protein [Gordonia malaquae]